MNRLLLILVAALCSCTAARKTTISPDGTVVLINGGQLGGKYTLAYSRTPRGGVKFVEKIDNEKSLGDTLMAAGAAYGLHEAALTQQGYNAGQTAEVIGAQKAGVATQAIKSQTALGLGAQSVEKVRIP